MRIVNNLPKLMAELLIAGEYAPAMSSYLDDRAVLLKNCPAFFDMSSLMSKKDRYYSAVWLVRASSRLGGSLTLSQAQEKIRDCLNDLL